jgi:sulfoxide reductase heme-binding subunit YedZ
MPLAALALDHARNGLGANPIQAITLRTGKTALVLLVLSLTVTPLATFGWRGAMRLRRPLGVYAFGYAALHFLTFIGLDYGFNLAFLREGLIEKPFALVGLAAGTLLLPLALTSTRGWMRRLGRNWKRLHWLVYIAAPLAIVHDVWQVKADYRQPLLYGLVVAMLLLLRVPAVRRVAAQAAARLRMHRSQGVAATHKSESRSPIPCPLPEGGEDSLSLGVGSFAPHSQSPTPLFGLALLMDCSDTACRARTKRLR